MTAPPTLSIDARLVPGVAPDAADLPGSWYITHGLGKPAENTYTEVAFEGTFVDEDGAALPEHVLDEAVRAVAGQLYGTAWAFHYRPDQAEESIHRYSLRRRERVLITALEVWT